MRLTARAVPVLLLAVSAACGSDAATSAACCLPGDSALHVVNAFTSPVDVLIDGAVVISGLQAGAINSTTAPSGSHTIVFRTTGANASTSSAIATTGALSAIAAVRTLSGGIGGAVLDDTNSVVPAGATKLRVLHLAPGAGELQVYRLQPDMAAGAQPVSWQFPFTYQAQPSALSAPFYQSTPGTWEVRIWQTPTGASGWANAPIKVIVPLASGERKTILMLDKPGGGLRVEVM